MTQADVLIQGKRLVPSDSPEYIASARMPFDEFLDWEYEGGLTEWVDGEVFVYVSATYEHQRVQAFLTGLLGGWAELTNTGQVLTAPYAIRAEHGGSGREPDLVFVRAEHSSLLNPRFLAGAPDLAIEIVSAESAGRDRITKRREYEQAGIAEYWIIDARPNINRAEFLALDDVGRYQPLAVVDGVVHSRALPGFWLRLDWLWAPDAKPLAALRELRGGSLD